MLNNKERLKAHTVKLPECDCWQWQSQVSNSGYGRIMLCEEGGGIRMQSAHRASYISYIGPLPPDKKVVQTCGNRLCINPAHLQITDMKA